MNCTTALRPSESSLHAHIRLARGTKRELGGFFLRAETMFNVATEVEEKELHLLDRGAWEFIHEKSHGEAFLYVMQHRFRRKSLFILDEPESALSPQRQLAALALIHQLVNDGCQFVIATHSPILMAYPDAHIFHLDPEQGVRQIAYRETEHFVVTRAFLQNPEGMLARVLDGEDAAHVAATAHDAALIDDGTW